MFISEKLVFIELHKTACTHIDNLLCKILGGKLEGKHNKAYPSLFNDNRKFIGSIRNPWDWYVSLWAFGCEHKGGIYKHVTKSRWDKDGIIINNGYYFFLLSLLAKCSKEPSKWKEAYSDVNDPECFRAWFKMIQDPLRSFDFGEHYALTPMHNFAGLLTYRYFNLFTSNASQKAPFKNLHVYEDLVSFDSENCFIDSFIQNENLEEDFLKALEKAGVEISQQDRETVYSGHKTNASKHDQNTAQFYDHESNDIIMEKDKFIIDKFCYQSPLV